MAAADGPRGFSFRESLTGPDRTVAGAGPSAEAAFIFDEQASPAKTAPLDLNHCRRSIAYEVPICRTLFNHGGGSSAERTKRLPHRPPPGSATLTTKRGSIRLKSDALSPVSLPTRPPQASFACLDQGPTLDRTG